MPVARVVDGDQVSVGCAAYIRERLITARASVIETFLRNVFEDAGGVSFFTGIAVVNTNVAPVDVTIKVFLSNGIQNGNTVVRTLAPGEKYVRLLSQIEGIGTLQAQTSGYIHVTAANDVFSFVIFGNDALDFLCAVPAQ